MKETHVSALKNSIVNIVVTRIRFLVVRRNIVDRKIVVYLDNSKATSTQIWVLEHHLLYYFPTSLS